jgi:glycerophosphoryl diester phosphodiesterase
MGTLGREGQSLDSQYRDNGADRNYLELVKDGVDVIATDRFWAVQQQILNRNIYFFRFQKAAGR